MRTVKGAYQKIAMKKLDTGDYCCLAEAVRYRSFSRKSLVKAFKEIIPKDDYVIDEEKGLIDYLERLTNMLEEGEIRA